MHHIIERKSVRPDLAKFLYFGKIFQVLDNFLRLYLLFGKSFNRLWQILYAIGQVFVDINGQMLKKIKPSGHTERDGMQSRGAKNFIGRH